MPYFLMLADDRADGLDDRLAYRQEHLDYWAAKPGVVKLAGAMLDGDRPCGSSILIEAEDEAAARLLIAEDPFSVRGVFTGAPRIIKFRPAIGDWFPAA